MKRFGNCKKMLYLCSVIKNTFSMETGKLAGRNTKDERRFEVEMLVKILTSSWAKVDLEDGFRDSVKAKLTKLLEL